MFIVYKGFVKESINGVPGKWELRYIGEGRKGREKHFGSDRSTCFKAKALWFENYHYKEGVLKEERDHKFKVKVIRRFETKGEAKAYEQELLTHIRTNYGEDKLWNKEGYVEGGRKITEQQRRAMDEAIRLTNERKMDEYRLTFPLIEQEWADNKAKKMAYNAIPPNLREELGDNNFMNNTEFWEHIQRTYNVSRSKHFKWKSRLAEELKEVEVAL